MSALPIVLYGDKALQSKAVDIPHGPALESLVKDMTDTLLAAEGLGLAAPQIGFSARVILFKTPAESALIELMVNPCIIHQEGRVIDDEGCLSLPGLSAPVPRASNITVSYADLEGIIHQEDFSSLTARVIQHEIDHLDGILYIDRINPIQRSRILRKWKLSARHSRLKSLKP